MKPEEIKIEKNIPFPERRYGPKTKYPWMELNVGDSFAFEGTAAAAHAAATYYNGKTRKVFRARVHNGGARVWRVK